MATRIIAKNVTDLDAAFSYTDGDVLQFAEGEQTITNSATTQLSGLSTGLEAIFFGRRWAGTIPESIPLKADVDASGTAKVVHQSPGGSVALYAGGGTGVIARIKKLGGGRLMAVGGGTVTTWEHAIGKGHATADVSITNLWVLGGMFDCPYKSTAITVMEQTGGTANIGRSITTLRLYGGQCNVFREDTSATVPVSTTITLAGSGTLYWQGGDITTLNISGPNCSVDFSNITKAITVGTINITADAITSGRSMFKGRDFDVTYTTKNVRGFESDVFP